MKSFRKYTRCYGEPRHVIRDTSQNHKITEVCDLVFHDDGRGDRGRGTIIPAAQ
jgi:hypothetical protein